ncbi:class I SAM-dependent methyltransferase [Palaeococcus sp. (in: euryarchaeotes)]
MHELYTVLAGYYDAIYSRRVQDIEKEIDFVESIFMEDAKRKIKQILDLACGTGIPTLEMVGRGYEVLGVDLHEEMLEVARKKAKNCQNVSFMQGDALEIAFREEFDAATMFFSSIMYFDEEAIKRLFSSVVGAIREGGVFIADFPNPLVMKSSGPFVWDEKRGDETLIITDWRELENASQRLHFKRLVQILKPSGEVRAFYVHDILNLYTPREMRLLAREYFSDVKIYGDLKRELGGNARRFWLVGVK